MENIKILSAVILAPILIAIFFDFVVAAIAMIVFASALFATQKITKRDFVLVIVVFFVFSEAYYLYYTPAIYIAKNQGTVLDDNWFNALSWIKNNTPECTVVATYWDPGHFITGIARRAVVFDGASQGDVFTRPTDSLQNGVVVEKYDNNINHIVLYKNGNKTTARIQDISTTLLTANESLALSILREYRKPGCNSMYYIASSDLIPKSTWWTYFSTWNPVDKKGTPYVYTNAPQPGFRMTARPDIRQNAIIYTYPISQQESFVLYETNTTPIVFLQQQGTAQPLKVEKFIYFSRDGTGRLYTDSTATIQGLVWIDPSKNSLMFIPPQLEGAMFTRMFLFNGAGLEHFEYVNNWGGEVKLYKINFPD